MNSVFSWPAKVNFRHQLDAHARHLPFRTVCLLGHDDWRFTQHRGRRFRIFDLMAQALWPVNRSRREDDRYLFLEAIAVDREHFTSWVGRQHSAGRLTRPHRLLVGGQLQDHLNGLVLATARANPIARVTGLH